MPQRRNAVKRLRQDKKRHARNLKLKINLKKTIKKFRSLLAGNNVDEAKKSFKELTGKLDRATSQKVIHKNTASRLKSRLSKRVAKLAV
ncbi:MAG: 30S ribosomal protein S20 [Candidatus Omnitrophota bacterium]|nr:30S ribosomal protein S20 [Candidatus Omnitrophota bacterium]